MGDRPVDQGSTNQGSTGESPFERRVRRGGERKLKALRDGPQGIWFGLGMSGLVGWSVAVPTLGGALIGAWLDHRYTSGHSWTLALLAAGLIVGCANAWHWIAEQNDAMKDGSDKKTDVGDE